MTMARDIEGGFVDRLVVSPAPRITLIVGPLMAAGLRSLFTTTVVLSAGLIGGVGLPGLVDTVGALPARDRLLGGHRPAGRWAWRSARGRSRPPR